MRDHSHETGRNGLFRRLLGDERGNTLAIFAAALLPMVAMVGGGIDMGRAYMVEARLQQACDAGVLAGRKSMATKVYGTQDRARAQELFAVNYPVVFLGSKNTSFTTASNATSTTVSGIASTTLPTILMAIFGKKSIAVDVDCSATQEVSNTDMTLVLDTTGSMDFQVPDGKGGFVKRIDALKSAVKNFYDIIATKTAGSTSRARFAFVPYAQTVNVGRLIYDIDPSYLIGGSGAGATLVQTRRVLSSYNSYIERLSGVSSSECSRFNDNLPVSGKWKPSDSGYTIGQNASRNGQANIFYVFQPSNYYSFYDVCDRTVRPLTHQLDAGARFENYEYVQQYIEMSNYVASIKTGNRVRRPSEFNYVTDVWPGCIEEADTVASANIAYSPATKSITPSGTYDLNIDLIPFNDATRWKPQWQEIMYVRGNYPNWSRGGFDTRGDEAGRNCPKEARPLAVMSQTDFYNYTNSLTPFGGTYHDAGMLWGGRISSPDGIFGATVKATAPNNGYVSRHLIFMTDGAPGAQPHLTSLYGLEWHDQKIVPSGPTSYQTVMDAQNARHTQRMGALCESIKAKGIRVWVIVFESSLTNELRDCASPNSSFTSDNADSLNGAFVKIANSISELRIVQ